MDMKGILEVIREQRHDFLNHLQVISGYLQLQKQEIAYGYIKKISGMLREQGKIFCLKIPEINAVLLVEQKKAREHGIEVIYNIQDDLDNCTLPSEVLSALLETIFYIIISYLASYGLSNGRLEVDLSEERKQYFWRFLFLKPVVEDIPALMHQQISLLRQRLALYKGEVILTDEKEKGYITLILPQQAS